jgi:hypothetical protein
MLTERQLGITPEWRAGHHRSVASHAPHAGPGSLVGRLCECCAGSSLPGDGAIG